MKRKIILMLLCLVFVGITLYFGLGFYRQWREYKEGEQVYENLTQYVQPATQPAAAGEETLALAEEETEDTAWPTVDFEALREINPDIVGWIMIEGTDVNYPVVQGPDNSYYLYRLFDGTSNGAGSIFMDYRNDPALGQRNTVLYGHHMQNGTMFQQITKYKDQSFYETHPTGMLLTPSGNYKIHFVAGYVTNMNSDAWKLEFADDEEFSLWLERAIAQSAFTATVTPQAGDRVITLSTCTYEYDDARFILVGILE